MLDQGYGIMPNAVLFDKDLSSTSKLIFVYISSLCAQQGYCWASNEHIAQKLGISKYQVSRHISKLSKYLTITNPTNEQRQIRLAQNVNPACAKPQGSLAQKRKHNNTKNITSLIGRSRYKTPQELGLPDLGGY